MNPEGRCEEARELLPEVALGIADGADRARVLEHTADCAECRLELERQSTIADELLTLAPEEEPGPGFELGVLRAIEPPPARRRSILRLWPALAAAAAAALITAGAMLFAFRDDRRVADEYRATLARAHGTYFGSVRLTDAAGRPGGVLYRYRGSPSWLLVTVAPPHRAAIERAELVDRSGRRIPIASFRLVDGVWGGSLRVDLRDVAAVHLVGRDGRSVLVAQF
jgi:Putative zinc-finger